MLKNLGSKPNECKKAWFIEIDKIFQEKNLKIFYLPVSALHKLIASKSYVKLPDPTEYMVGLSFMVSRQEETFDVFKPDESVIQTRKTSTSRNNTELKIDTSNRSPFNLTSKRKSIVLGFGTPQVIQNRNFES